MPDQTVFEECYRGRQSPLHHMAYMRLAKGFLTLEGLRMAGMDLRGTRIFDYGFGAGTFFRYCPPDSKLFGVEIDPANVADVRRSLAEREREADLQTIRMESWSSHPLLSRQYDFFLCSHVLEHLPDPVDFLRKVRSGIPPKGHFIGLVPLNERTDNPHHVNKPDRAMIERWVREAGYALNFYAEDDPFIYWFQPLFAADTGWRHKAAQAVSLGLGMAATFLGPRAWFAFGRFFAQVTFSKPTQAVFLLQPL